MEPSEFLKKLYKLAFVVDIYCGLPLPEDKFDIQEIEFEKQALALLEEFQKPNLERIKQLELTLKNSKAHFNAFIDYKCLHGRHVNDAQLMINKIDDVLNLK